MRQALTGLLLSIALWTAGCATVPAVREQPEPASTAAQHRSPLMEPPGAFLAEVTQATVATTICVPGWTSTVRPSPSFTNAVKLRMLKRAGLEPGEAAEYELDHFVPLALGGHPRSEENLWLQPWSGTWGARVKDQLERRLQVMVCAGQLSLQTAREAIQRGWKEAYRRFVGGSREDLPQSEFQQVD